VKHAEHILSSLIYNSGVEESEEKASIEMIVEQVEEGSDSEEKLTKSKKKRRRKRGKKKAKDEEEEVEDMLIKDEVSQSDPQFVLTKDEVSQSAGDSRCVFPSPAGVYEVMDSHPRVGSFSSSSSSPPAFTWVGFLLAPTHSIDKATLRVGLLYLTQIQIPQGFCNRRSLC